MSYFPRLCATFMSAEKLKFVLLNMNFFLEGGTEYYGSLIKHTHTQILIIFLIISKIPRED